jgi:phosphoglycolate phosphatase-like HAD superfamily hydrolase
MTSAGQPAPTRAASVARGVLPGQWAKPPAPAVTTLALPKVLLCDLDGTLIDTMPMLTDLGARVIADAFAIDRFLARELYRATCGLPFAQQLEIVWPRDPRNPGIAGRFAELKAARCGAARMRPATREALLRLRCRGVRVAVSSNNETHMVNAFVAREGFPFDLALGFGGDLCKGEPHLTRVERAFGVARDQMLFAGDSLHDGEIAEAARVPFVGIAGTFAKERFFLRFPGKPVVSRLADLADLFG